MPRPKGSKNKSKKQPITNGGQSIPEAYSAPVPEIEKEAEVIVEEVLKNPEVTKEVSPDSICLCEHKKKMHYGGEKGWCNTEGCYCQTFR